MGEKQVGRKEGIRGRKNVAKKRYCRSERERGIEEKDRGRYSCPKEGNLCYLVTLSPVTSSRTTMSLMHSSTQVLRVEGKDWQLSNYIRLNATNSLKLYSREQKISLDLIEDMIHGMIYCFKCLQ